MSLEKGSFNLLVGFQEPLESEDYVLDLLPGVGSTCKAFLPWASSVALAGLKLFILLPENAGVPDVCGCAQQLLFYTAVDSCEPPIPKSLHPQT